MNETVTTRLSGRGAKVRIGCTCAALHDADCKCANVQRLTFANWSYNPNENALIGHAFESFQTTPPVAEGTIGGYWMPPHVLHALRKIDARCKRQQRKRQRHRERQKRKQ